MTIPDQTWMDVGGGVKLHVLRWPPSAGGDGDLTSFVLVHGLASNARLWDGLAMELTSHGFAAAAVDQRGHGLSDKPDDGYDFATATADLVVVLEELGGPQPIAVGQSWGGNVVLELAAMRPDLLRGVVCVDGGWIDLSRFGTWSECEAALAPPRMAGTAASDIEKMLRGRHRDWPESGIRGALACFEVRDDGTVAPWLSYERHLRILRSLWEQRLVDLFPKVKVPVLLVPCDDGSDWVEHKRNEVRAAEEGLSVARTHWFDADHDVHAQHPVDLATVVMAAVDDGFFG